MKRALTVACVSLGVAAFGAPATQAGSGNGGKSAVAKHCTQLAKTDRAAFRATYGERAMRKCIRGAQPAAKRVGKRELANAAQDCRAQRQADPETFRDEHGTNDNRRNAFGNCVVDLVRDADRRPETPAGPPTA